MANAQVTELLRLGVSEDEFFDREGAEAAMAKVILEKEQVEEEARQRK